MTGRVSARALPSLADVDWPVRTERLLLRPATHDDLEVIWHAWRRREDVGRWMNNPWPDLDVYLERLGASEKLATILAVELHDGSGSRWDGRVVMDLHVRVMDSWAQSDVVEAARATKANLGWSMDPEVRGRGLATEAVLAALSVCFDSLRLHRVEADCYAPNSASAALMERVGMTREGHQRAVTLHRDLGWVDQYSYAMLDTDWQTRQEARHA
ncbi:RimJ/RimL family protein N-acetyltransferase [Knoellia remsis]|uniref:RimJ/RimL family protein N-acetyltransferase n=1 Tax=Knoellia remsis TaxID=407159 RepID=A0A2T0U7Z1_9MICO|nr:RimJ/RimL family protein N-acetyltransferase [Knoellia remsis]